MGIRVYLDEGTCGLVVPYSNEKEVEHIRKLEEGNLIEILSETRTRKLAENSIDYLEPADESIVRLITEVPENIQ